MKTVIFAKDVNLSKLVEMLKICPCCKYVSNLYQTITFTSLLRINTYLANICICPHFSRQRKCNANLELQIYHIFAPFANISKSVFSSSGKSCSRCNRKNFLPLECSPNFPRAQYLDIRTAESWTNSFITLSKLSMQQLPYIFIIIACTQSSTRQCLRE